MPETYSLEEVLEQLYVVEKGEEPSEKLTIEEYKEDLPNVPISRFEHIENWVLENLDFETLKQLRHWDWNLNKVPSAEELVGKNGTVEEFAENYRESEIDWPRIEDKRDDWPFSQEKMKIIVTPDEYDYDIQDGSHRAIVAVLEKTGEWEIL